MSNHAHDPQKPAWESSSPGSHSAADALVPCPQCAELIRPAAKICRYCRCDIQTVSAPPVAYPLPSLDLEQVSCDEFMHMALAMTKLRDEEPLTQHEKRLVGRFGELQSTHGEERLKTVMAEKLAERQLMQMDAPTLALIEHMREHLPGMRDEWDRMSNAVRVAAIEQFPDVCEECGARANMVFDAVVPVRASTSGDIGSWYGKGSFNVGTTVDTKHASVCMRCRDRLQPPMSESDRAFRNFLSGCFVVVVIVGIMFGLVLCAKTWQHNPPS